jgi:ABC-type transporter Mla MlaB component
MLRITHEKGTRSRVTLRLEGSLVGQWAALLERECSVALGSRHTLNLDLTGVNFVDRAGVEVLERLSRAGVGIRCHPGPVASVLEGEGVAFSRGTDDRNDAGRPPGRPRRRKS